MTLFLIKGGYDIIRKQIVNISLHQSTAWAKGLLYGRQNKFCCHLNPAKVNEIELIKHNNMHILLLNNAIIFEHEKLFNYKIELNINDNFPTSPENNSTLYAHYFVNYCNITNTQSQRNLN